MSKNNIIEEITQFKTPEQSPGYLLWQVSIMWRSFIEDTLKPHGLTHPQFVVLATTAWLTKDGEIVSQSDVSYATGLDPNTTSQILRGLEQKKLIKREKSLNERSKNPFLTDAGLAILDKALPAVEQSDMQFFEVLSVKEQETLFNIFQKLVTIK